MPWRPNHLSCSWEQKTDMDTIYAVLGDRLHYLAYHAALSSAQSSIIMNGMGHKQSIFQKDVTSYK